MVFWDLCKSSFLDESRKKNPSSTEGQENGRKRDHPG